MKTCGKCKQSLALDDFSRHARSPDGLQHWCRTCQRAHLKARRQELAARTAIQVPDRKRCPSCQAEKSSTEFHVSRGSKDGLQPYCAACSVLVHREYLERNAQAVAAKRAEKLIRGSQNNTGEKVCTRCGQSKPMLSFYMHRGTKDGRATHCAECQKARTRQWNAENKERIQARNADYAAANPERRKRDHRQFWLKMYGLSQEDYAGLLVKQDGVCAICQLPERYVDARTGELRRLAVDHDHSSGKVRGLLCGRCNVSIGQFADDAERLSRAAAYLREAAGTRG